MFKVSKMYLYMMFFWGVLTVFSFAAESAASGQPYKVGFEFQESNHLFKQGNDRNPQLLHQNLIKTPLFSVNYKGQRIFHVEADDYDLEIITMPFSSGVEHSDFLVESFRILQTFVDRIYEFLGEHEEAKNLDDFVKRIAGSIRGKTYFTEVDDEKCGAPSLKSADHDTLGLELEKEEGVLRTIRLYKKPDFTPGFKPQFSVQTNLTNFILSYFYLFCSGAGGVQTAPMAAMQEALAGRKLEDQGRIIDPAHNFIALYLYTCISPRIVRDREGGGGTLLSSMISAHQCDYKMFLPLMSRVSFSSLSAGTGDWKAVMAAQWPRETFEQYQTIGDHEFGDFYDSRLTTGLKEKLIPTVEVDGSAKPDSDLPLIRAALNQGIVTTHVLKKLDERAFSTPDDRGRANEYISRYGQHVFNSIGQPENEHMRLELKEEEKSCGHIQVRSATPAHVLK